MFTPTQIARMYEVEFTSELMILMLQGVFSKSKPNIDSFYRLLDPEFASAEEVQRRFRDILDTIDNLFDAEKIERYFGSRSLFYALFATIYGLRYGLKTQFNQHDDLARERGRPLSQEVSRHIFRAAEAIHTNREVPQIVSQSLRGATSDLASRREVIKYLAGEDNNPCPPMP